MHKIKNVILRKHKAKIDRRPPDALLRLFARDPTFLHFKMNCRNIKVIHDGGYIRYIQKDFKYGDNDR